MYSGSLGARRRKAYFWTMVGIFRWRSLLGVVWLFLLPTAQPDSRTIAWENPGLEALPSEVFRMAGWAIWGKGATPDIQPGRWGVSNKPAEGDSFIGLVTREDRSTEGIWQKLSKPIPAGQCHYLTVWLARHGDYSGHRLPLSLQVRGSQGTDGPIIDLAITPPITHKDWRLYTLEFTAPQALDRIVLEGSPVPGAVIAYRGNLLVDGLSGISPCLRASLGSGHRPFTYL